MPYKDPMRAKENYQANRERLKAVRRAWYLANKEEIAIKAVKYRERRKVRANERKDETNARRRQRYAEEHGYRDKILTRVRERTWNLPPEEFEAFTAMYNEECFYCGEPGGAIDHLVPRSRGGEDRLYNLVPSCQSCNSSKGIRTPGEWYDGLAIRRPETTG